MGLQQPDDGDVDGSGGLLGTSLNISLPKANDVPAEPAQCAPLDTVALSVCTDLRNPVAGIRASPKRGPECRPSSAVPEVTVTEHRHLC